MFRMDKATEELLKSETPNKRQEAQIKRQKVYDYIINNNSAKECKSLAEAAGYDMSSSCSESYKKGANFISRLIRDGYIDKVVGRDGETYFYIGSKEAYQPESEPVHEARKILEEQIEEYEEDMGPEGQSKEDWATDDPIDDFPGAEEFLERYSGQIMLFKDNQPEVKITVEFQSQSCSDITTIINNIKETL